MNFFSCANDDVSGVLKGDPFALTKRTLQRARAGTVDDAALMCMACEEDPVAQPPDMTIYTIPVDTGVQGI